jgi:hypothetical protein
MVVAGPKIRHIHYSQCCLGSSVSSPSGGLLNLRFITVNIDLHGQAILGPAVVVEIVYRVLTLSSMFQC